jgi:hypothetical protein
LAVKNTANKRLEDSMFVPFNRATVTFPSPRKDENGIYPRDKYEMEIEVLKPTDIRNAAMDLVEPYWQCEPVMFAAACRVAAKLSAIIYDPAFDNESGYAEEIDELITGPIFDLMVLMEMSKVEIQ